MLAQTNIAMSDKTFFLSLLLAATASLVSAKSPPQTTEPVREMSTDRPDITESAYSVAPGMFQVEMSFFDYERDRSGPDRLDTWIYGQVNFKYGITENSDLQLIFDTHTVSRAIGQGTRDVVSGFGDVTMRYKQPLWGNDSGRTAFALMPFVTIPTGSDVSADAWAGGLVMPLAVTLTERIAMGLMAEVDLVPDAETNGHDLEYLISGTLGFSLTERWGLFTEVVGIFGEDADALGLFDTGLTFALSENLVFDAGVRIGLNRAAPDLGVFSGMSFRF